MNELFPLLVITLITGGYYLYRIRRSSDSSSLSRRGRKEPDISDNPAFSGSPPEQLQGERRIASHGVRVNHEDVAIPAAPQEPLQTDQEIKTEINRVLVHSTHPDHDITADIPISGGTWIEARIVIKEGHDHFSGHYSVKENRWVDAKRVKAPDPRHYRKNFMCCIPVTRITPLSPVLFMLHKGF